MPYLNSSLIDEINLAMIQGAPAPDKERNYLSLDPAIVKNRHRRIHLQRRKSEIDLSQDSDFDYGLPGEGLFSQTNETDLKIIAVEGNYSQEGESDETEHKQEQEDETGFTGDGLMEKTFTEMEAADPYNVSTMTSNLSLGMEPGEIRVLRDIFESNFIGGGCNPAPIPSLQSLCNHIVDRDMTCPTCNSRVRNKGRHVIISQGCESYPFPFTRSTRPLNGEIKPNQNTSTKHK